MGTRKRILLGAAVGTTVFGTVFGLAAGLDVASTDQLGSGQAAVTSCDQTGVTTSFVFDGATGNVTDIQVDGISDNCDGATVSVAASHSYTDTSNNNYNNGSMVSGSRVLTTYLNVYNDFEFENNSIVVPLDNPMNAELFDTVTVTLHGGHPAQNLPA